MGRSSLRTRTFCPCASLSLSLSLLELSTGSIADEFHRTCQGRDRFASTLTETVPHSVQPPPRSGDLQMSFDHWDIFRLLSLQTVGFSASRFPFPVSCFTAAPRNNTAASAPPCTFSALSCSGLRIQVPPADNMSQSPSTPRGQEKAHFESNHVCHTPWRRRELVRSDIVLLASTAVTAEGGRQRFVKASLESRNEQVPDRPFWRPRWFRNINANALLRQIIVSTFCLSNCSRNFCRAAGRMRNRAQETCYGD